MGDSPSVPPVQNAQSVAAQQTGINQAAAQQSQRGSMVNQSNPYGSLNYTQTGTSSDGTPIYSSSLNFTPTGQNLFNFLTGSQTAAGQGGQNLISGANYGSQSPTQAIGNQTSGIQGGLMSQWLQSQAPWMQIQTTQLDTKLRNQGLNPSPTATNDPSTWGPYEQAMAQLNQANSMAVAGAASQFQPQAFQEASNLYTMPASLGAQLAQFGAPQSPGSSLVQTPGLTEAPANLEGDVATQEQAQMAAYQAQVAQQSALMKGLMGIGAAGVSAIPGILPFSDLRVKRHIKPHKYLKEIGIWLYKWKYIWDDVERIGPLAYNVLKLIPEAVVEINGYLCLDQTQLPQELRVQNA